MDRYERIRLAENRRAAARYSAKELLWENLERNNLWEFFRYEFEEPDRRKAQIQFDNYLSALQDFFTSISYSINLVEHQEIHQILQFGAGRRISSLFRTAATFSHIVSHDRTEPLNQEEVREVSDCLLLFYVHMVGALDAIAISLVRLSDASLGLAERNADILQKNFRKKIGFDSIEELFEENDAWFFRIKDDLRNRFVHRVPPYVPPSVMSEAETQRFHELEEKIWDAMKNQRFDDVDAYRAEQKALGRFSAVISFIDTSTVMPLITTVTDDLMRFQYLYLSIFEALAPRVGLTEQD
ncbi:MAG: hypothetical protein NXH79_06185 [Rhodobacteraceae bacterium]|nr:hypothetical protein [Paracoccaceae bacterium]